MGHHYQIWVQCYSNASRLTCNLINLRTEEWIVRRLHTDITWMMVVVKIIKETSK